MAIDVIQTQENKFRINSAKFIDELISLILVGEIHSNLLEYSFFLFYRKYAICRSSYIILQVNIYSI